MSKQGILNSYRQIETSFFNALVRRPPIGFVEHATVRLLFLSILAFSFAIILPGALSKLCWIIAFVAPSLLILCLIVLAWRWVMGHILWKVRNRLLVTCLLLALAPLLLFGTLASIASYVFAGQFGTSAAMTGIDEDLALAHDRVAGLARIPVPILRDRVVEMPGEHSVIDAWQDGKPLIPQTPHTSQTAASVVSPFGEVTTPPTWLKPGFSGIVAAAGKLYLCAAAGNDDPAHPLLVLQSALLNDERVNTFAAGLGTLSINPGFNISDGNGRRGRADTFNQAAAEAEAKKAIQEVKEDQDDPNPDVAKVKADQDKADADIAKADAAKAKAKSAADAKPGPHPRGHKPLRLPYVFGNPPPPPHRRHIAEPAASQAKAAPGKLDPDDDDFSAFSSLHGGTLAAGLNFFDAPIFASTPLTVVSWKTGDKVPAWMMITSRPSLLYKRLFSNSLEVAQFVRIALVATAITFGILELFALLLAIGLIRTITQSVADLYDATRQIESGNLLHRIRVKRRDQLAALATSFNTMSGSLAELLEQQREKDRMQNELNIAHEVQNNLFPHSPFGLPGMELYGICNPARTIGGDYYDFIPMGNQQVYLALGDISGKGISAALLMSSLHSAVRVYLQGESHQSLSAVTSGDVPLPAPGKLLSLLNEHLFSNTTPEKYATLFVASYDSATRRLTYSNGGHLPPIVLCTSGEVIRLEAGGSVVGLLGGMEYKEATVQLNAGDLLIAYSDGLTEPEQNGVEFGEERLIEVIRKNRHRPLPAIANYTVQCLKDWMGEGEQPDDITIVFARLT